MENGLVTPDGTKVLTVEENDRFIQTVPNKFRPIFEINVITGLRYIELQRLYQNPGWYFQDRNQIILPKEAQKKVKQKAPACHNCPHYERTGSYCYALQKTVYPDKIDSDCPLPENMMY